MMDLTSKAETFLTEVEEGTEENLQDTKIVTGANQAGTMAAKEVSLEMEADLATGVSHRTESILKMTGRKTTGPAKVIGTRKEALSTAIMGKTKMVVEKDPEVKTEKVKAKTKVKENHQKDTNPEIKRSMKLQQRRMILRKTIQVQAAEAIVAMRKNEKTERKKSTGEITKEEKQICKNKFN